MNTQVDNPTKQSRMLIGQTKDKVSVVHAVIGYMDDPDFRMEVRTTLLVALLTAVKDVSKRTTMKVLVVTYENMSLEDRNLFDTEGCVHPVYLVNQDLKKKQYQNVRLTYNEDKTRFVFTRIMKVVK